MLAAETSDLIEFHGGLDWALRDEAFRSASAVVVPSRAEPFGMVVVEAMECGVPVLYTGRAGVAEIIDVGQVDPSDSAGVANRLAQLLENETVWLRVAQMQLEAINDYREAEYEKRSAERLGGAYLAGARNTAPLVRAARAD